MTLDNEHSLRKTATDKIDFQALVISKIIFPNSAWNIIKKSNEDDGLAGSNIALFVQLTIEPILQKRGNTRRIHTYFMFM